MAVVNLLHACREDRRALGGRLYSYYLLFIHMCSNLAGTQRYKDRYRYRYIEYTNILQSSELYILWLAGWSTYVSVQKYVGFTVYKDF